MKQLILMRGVPASGKTTKAKKLEEMACDGRSAALLSTDDFWANPYNFELYRRNFKPQYLPMCHAWNQGRCVREMIFGTEYIIIDACNATQKDCQPYIDLAHQFDYEISISEPETDIWHQCRSALVSATNSGDDRVIFDEIGDLANQLAKISEKTHMVPVNKIYLMLLRFELKINLTKDKPLTQGESK